MTSLGLELSILSTVIARLDRAIQYSAAAVVEPRSCGVLDAPPSRRMTAVVWMRFAKTLITELIASPNHTREQEFLHHSR
jgi:hypothetical protein